MIFFFFRVVIPVIGSDWQQITWSDFTDKNKQVVEEGEEEEEAGGFPFHSVEAASLSFLFLSSFFELFGTCSEQTVGIFGNIFAAWCDVLTFWGYWMGNEKPIFKVIEKDVAISFLFSFFLGYAVLKKTFWHFGTFSVLVEPKDPSFKDSSEALDHWQAAGPWAWARASGGFANIYVKKHTRKKKNKNKILLKEKKIKLSLCRHVEQVGPANASTRTQFSQERKKKKKPQFRM